MTKEQLLTQEYLEKYTLRKITIDSCKIRIPFEEVKLIKTDLDDKWYYMSSESGEIDESEFKNRAYWYNVDGISTKYAVEHQTIEGGLQKKYLVVLISSKMLKELYFYGITYNTIQYLLEGINAQLIVELELYQLLTAECVDIDFKIDHIMEMHEFEGLIELSKYLAIPKAQLKAGYQIFMGKGNKGISFGTRKTQTPKTNPFFKHYHKGLELKERSWLFADKYLDNQVYDKRCRTEFTIKDREHLKSLFGSPQSDLRYLVSIEQSKLFKALSDCLAAHLYIPARDFLPSEKIFKNPADQIIANLIEVAITSKFSEQHIIEICIHKMDGKDRKHQQRLRIRGIIRELVYSSKGTQNKLNKNKAAYELYKWLAYDEKDDYTQINNLRQSLIFYNTITI
ncbi:MAG: hypothetical protein COA58_02930 [Bacteroidetes bacterium]|nr:MAG: hypothetical protein COA58_02930 [Bacteroidota bacterium]